MHALNEEINNKKACEFSINASSELNMYCVFLFADVNDFCWLQNKSTMSFYSCLLVDEFMLSLFHKFISISNIDFLISIVDVLSFDAELLLLLSFTLLFVKLLNIHKSLQIIMIDQNFNSMIIIFYIVLSVFKHHYYD